MSLGIIFDMSGSMKGKLAVARAAAATFLKTGSPEDEYFLVGFSGSPQILQDFTTDISRLQDRLAFTSADGRTALYDAVYLALDKIAEGANPKKALLVITDGGDNRSRYTLRDVREFVKESDVQIYSIGIVDRMASSGHAY